MSKLSFKDKQTKFFNNLEDNREFDPMFLYTLVRRNKNHIYFYSDVDEVSQFVLIQYLNEAQSDILEDHALELIEGKYVEGIFLHINSNGGLLSSGFAIYDFIKRMKIPVFGIVEGVAASAASLILLATDNRVVTDNSVVLFHQLSYGIDGTMQQHTDAHINAEHAMNKLMTIYLNETKLGYPLNKDGSIREDAINDMSEEELKDYRETNITELLKRDLELDRYNCIAYGVSIDETSFEEENEEVELTEEEQAKADAYVAKLIKQRDKQPTTKTKSKSRKK
jgi:ATP-dependent protease ClpP protease subunit